MLLKSENFPRGEIGTFKGSYTKLNLLQHRVSTDQLLWKNGVVKRLPSVQNHQTQIFFFRDILPKLLQIRKSQS